MAGEGTGGVEADIMETITAVLPRAPARVLRNDVAPAARSLFAQYRLLACIVVAHAAIAAAQMSRQTLAYNADIVGYGLGFLVNDCWPFLLLLVGWRALVAIVAVRPDEPVRYVAGDLRRLFLDPGRIVEGLLVTAILACFMSSFAQIKDAIPTTLPFNWDVAFADLDRALLLGHDAWTLFRPLLMRPTIVAAINLFYNLWMPLTLFVLVGVAFSRSDVRRKMAFLYAFLLTWIVGGNLLATVFSSAGPAFFARLGFGGRFDPLMQMLQGDAASYPVWALTTQDMLWQAYLDGGGPVSGISAMPSMHNATAVLMALFGFRLGRAAGVAFSVFAAFIYLGSICLGWHYAVDGVAGAAIAYAAWRAGLALAAQLDVEAPSGKQQPARSTGRQAADR